METAYLRDLLEEKYHLYNRLEFIEADPIRVPHAFSQPRDQEIAGLFAALFAWGQRATAIRKAFELLHLMGGQPYDFVLNHRESDLPPFEHFAHRTFNGTDALYFIHFLRRLYTTYPNMETCFLEGMQGQNDLKPGLIFFQRFFQASEHFPQRTGKHLASPANKSACKRLNMFLRWVARKDPSGVDLGIWQNISPAALYCPCDLHVGRVARSLGLLKRKQTDWAAVEELTEQLRLFCAEDPVKYDFALFGMGILEGR